MNKEEQRLYEMLFEILDYYAGQRASFDPVGVSANYIVSRIKKNISKCNEERRIHILEDIITLTNDRIIEGVGTKTVFHSLDGISCDLAKKVDKKKVKNITNIKDNKNETEKKEDFTKEDEDILVKQIIFYKNRYDIADREMLVDLESDANKKIMESTSKFKIPFGNANIEVISRLNSGMYGKNKKQLIEELNDLGIKTSKSGRFINRMNDDLLKYRLIALTLVINECRQNEEIIKPKYSEGHYNKNAYYRLLKKVNFIGKTVANEFKNQYGKLPKDSLIEEPFDKKYQQLVDSPQMILDELIDEESEKIIKKIRRGK